MAPSFPFPCTSSLRHLSIRQSSRRPLPNPETDLGLDVVNGVRGFDLEGDGLTREAITRMEISIFRSPPSPQASVLTS